MNADRIFSNVEDTAKDFWASRPRRALRGRMIAGVAAGIGRRYGVDPELVRVVFVVSTLFGGAGILFYLAGWLLLPAEGDQVSAAEGLIHRGRSSTSAGLTVVLGILLLIALAGGIHNLVATVVGGVMLLAALYLLHRGRAGWPNTGNPTTTGGNSMGGNETPTGRPPWQAGPEQPTEQAGAGQQGAGQSAQQTTEAPKPPSWDPLGAAPFAWDLPDPTPEPTEPEPRQRSPRFGWATIGAAVALGAVLIVVSPHSNWLDFRHDSGLVLAVLGLGMVAGSFARSGRWLIIPALLLSVVGLATPATLSNSLTDSGNVHYQPTLLSDVHSSYEHGAGNMVVDLRGLEGTGTVHTTVTEGAGKVTVLVPKYASVHATCHSSVGAVKCLGNRASGPGANTQGDQAGNSGITIDLLANDGAGDVEVSNG